MLTNMSTLPTRKEFKEFFTGSPVFLPTGNKVFKQPSLDEMIAQSNDPNEWLNSVMKFDSNAAVDKIMANTPGFNRDYDIPKSNAELGFVTAPRQGVPITTAGKDKIENTINQENPALNQQSILGSILSNAAQAQGLTGIGATKAELAQYNQDAKNSANAANLALAMAERTNNLFSGGQVGNGEMNQYAATYTPIQLPNEFNQAIALQKSMPISNLLQANTPSTVNVTDGIANASGRLNAAQIANIGSSLANNASLADRRNKSNVAYNNWASSLNFGY